MIGAIYALLNRIWTLMTSYQATRNIGFWGNGELGDVYIGYTAENAPPGFQVVTIPEGSTYVFPAGALLRYNTLIVDCPATFELSPVVVQCATACYIQAHFHADNLGTNSREAPFLYTNNGTSPTLQLSDAPGASTSPNGTLLIRTYFANNLPTEYKVLLTGASANNRGIANGGSRGASGGLITIYTKKGGLIIDDGNVQRVNANGSATAGNGGGMLSIQSPLVRITTSGYVHSNGQVNDGNGTASPLNIVPSASTDPEVGGGGLAMSFEILDKDEE